MTDVRPIPEHGLTGRLAQIADVAGVRAALLLAQERGGRELKLSDTPDGVLAKIVGAEAAAAIVREFGQIKLMIPMGPMRGSRGRRAAAARMLANGAPVSQVAALVDVHERTVFRVKARGPATAAPGLFDHLD